jgi:hypothetical protein
VLKRRRAPTVRWTIEVAGHNPCGFAVTPDHRSLVLSDGWGVAFRSLKLRRFDLGDGSLLAERRLGDAARAVGFGPCGQQMIAAFDKRLRLIGVESLEELERWERRVPRHANAVVWRARQVLLRNGNHDTAFVFDLDTGRHRRLELGEGFGLHELPDGRILAAGVLGGEGAIWELGSLDDRPRRLATTPAMHSAAVDENGGIWIAPGQPSERSLDMEGEGLVRVGIAMIKSGRATRHLLRYASPEAEPEKVKVPRRTRIIKTGAGELWAAGEQALVHDEAAIERLRLSDGEWLEPLIAPRDHWIQHLDPAAGVAFSVGSYDRGDTCEVACLAPAG